MKNILNEEVEKIKSMMGLELDDNSIEDMGDHQLEKSKKYIVSKPNNDTNQATVIYGGLLDTPEELLKDIPEELLKSKIVILSRFDKGFNDLIKDVQKLTQQKNSILYNTNNLDITSVNGFSTGSLKIQNVLNDYDFVGLIDPWLTKGLLKKIESSGSDIESWFSKKFWKEQLGKYTNTINLHDELKSILKDRAIELPNYEHENVKKDFLKNNWQKM